MVITGWSSCRSGVKNSWKTSSFVVYELFDFDYFAIMQTQWPSNPRSLPKILRPLLLIFKPLVQFLMLLWYLCVKIPAPDVFIVQVSYEAALATFIYLLQLLNMYITFIVSFMFLRKKTERSFWYFASQALRWRLVFFLKVNQNPC